MTYQNLNDRGRAWKWQKNELIRGNEEQLRQTVGTETEREII